MNSYDFYTTAYGKLHNRKYLPYWLFTPARRLIRSLANAKIPSFFIDNKESQQREKYYLKGKRIIVSLTSFPARLDNLWLVINCMFHQTCPPDKIILWLSSQEVKSINNIPDSLKELQGPMFEIRIKDKSLRSHTKYYFALQEFIGNNDVVITIDDDIFYPPNTIEMLLKEAESNPSAIVANDVLKCMYVDNNLASYKSWHVTNVSGTDKDFFFLGVGAVLYPPQALIPEAFNDEVFMQICKLADDVWLNAMARLNDTQVIHTSSKDILIEIKNKKTTNLKSQNVEQNMNDLQIENVRKYCKETFGKDPFAQ